MKNKAVCALIPFLFAGCAVQQPVSKAQTASGYPEATFAGASLVVVENKLVGACSQVGAAVTEASSNLVVCDKPMTGQAGVFTRLLIGNADSTPTVEKLRFVLNGTGTAVHVTAYHWAESQMVGGQVNKIDLSAGDVQRLLEGLGADDPSAARYSAESRVAVSWLKPEEPSKGDGTHYQVGASSCSVLAEPEWDTSVIKHYY